MASIKIKFRSSSSVQKEGMLYYQVIANRQVRQIRTNYKIFNYEWNSELETVVIPPIEKVRNRYLRCIQERIKWDINRLHKIIYSLDNNHNTYNADYIVTLYRNQPKENTFFQFMHQIIMQLQHLGKTRTSEAYTSALNSFMKFRNNHDILLDELNSDIMLSYEAYLKNRAICMNTISFYMRILKATYNRAVAKELTLQCHPFKYVYTGIAHTSKRAISFKDIKRINDLDLSLAPKLDFARDMFMFSFFTRGMSLIDMACLKKTDLRNGILTYKRRKTGQQISIKWEKCMQKIVTKYTMLNDSIYMLPIINSPIDNSRKLYKNALSNINKHLKNIAAIAKLDTILTMYVSRHSWASIAKSKNIPISIISEGMGHDSETTTKIYLASLDSSVIDRANKIILKGL